MWFYEEVESLPFSLHVISFGKGVCHVPNFSLGHNGLITFTIFMRVCQIDAKGQIIVEENY